MLNYLKKILVGKQNKIIISFSNDKKDLNFQKIKIILYFYNLIKKRKSRIKILLLFHKCICSLQFSVF